MVVAAPTLSDYQQRWPDGPDFSYGLIGELNGSALLLDALVREASVRRLVKVPLNYQECLILLGQLTFNQRTYLMDNVRLLALEGHNVQTPFVSALRTLTNKE